MNKNIEADCILNQKNWTGLTFLELAQAGRITKEKAEDLANNWMNLKYENLPIDFEKYFEEKDCLVRCLEEKIIAANS